MDLYETHLRDYDTAIEETLEALQYAVKAAKLRYIDVCVAIFESALHGRSATSLLNGVQARASFPQNRISELRRSNIGPGSPSFSFRYVVGGLTPTSMTVAMTFWFSRLQREAFDRSVAPSPCGNPIRLNACILHLQQKKWSIADSDIKE